MSPIRALAIKSWIQFFWLHLKVMYKLFTNYLFSYLQIYRQSLSLATFVRVRSNSKEVSSLHWQNRYPNLKATCHIKLKVFLWTKVLESLLLEKYLIPVAPTLNIHFLSFQYTKLFNTSFKIQKAVFLSQCISVISIKIYFSLSTK